MINFADRPPPRRPGGEGDEHGQGSVSVDSALTAIIADGVQGLAYGAVVDALVGTPGVFTLVGGTWFVSIGTLREVFKAAAKKLFEDKLYDEAEQVKKAGDNFISRIPRSKKPPGQG